MAEQHTTEVDALAAIRDLLPDECWVSRTVEVRCTDYAGATFSDGAVFTEEMCCLPCRIRTVLTRVTPPVDCHACRVLACEVEGNTADPHTCVTPPGSTEYAEGVEA